ncbi:hypothetical protein [Pseudomonas sp. PDM11]|uniref:hypothetical protein n=1 Tax=Pseudomonas sp. PDM11 TaxID=2769309 RepID=UPI00177FAD7D|nr:hypothetical protein [Pseudomonas sp. PDM11]MBD9399055.1 hypothetical protein [Pseudomonas sp. PDM11]
MTPISFADLEALLNEAQHHSLSIGEISARSQRLALSPADLLNTLSIEVARRFVLNEMSYDIGDAIMNGLMTAIIDLSLETQMPQPAFDIYRAFDDGEYLKRGDTNQPLPCERYTRPQLLGIVREFCAGLNKTVL